MTCRCQERQGTREESGTEIPNEEQRQGKCGLRISRAVLSMGRQTEIGEGEWTRTLYGCPTICLLLFNGEQKMCIVMIGGLGRADGDFELRGTVMGR